MGETNFVESSTPMVNSVLHATKILDYYASSASGIFESD